MGLADSVLPETIRSINTLPEQEKQQVYTDLLPEWIYEYGIDRETLRYRGHHAVLFRCPKNSRALEITVRREPIDRDPLFYINMADTFNNQISVLMVVVNDPDSPRFHVDIDKHNNRTVYGTVSRNIAAEVAAKEHGLAPGQVRRGLRVFRNVMPLVEQFVQRMKHELYFIEPLAYHNAISFERHGFSYVRGLADMIKIHKGFDIGGEYRAKLDGRNPFRDNNAWKTIRGRSWAIHDGILGHPFTGFQMYKLVGKSADIQTAPDIDW